MLKEKKVQFIIKLAVIIFFIVLFVAVGVMLFATPANAYGKKTEKEPIGILLLTDNADNKEASDMEAFMVNVEYSTTFLVPHQPNMGAVDTAEIKFFGLAFKSQEKLLPYKKDFVSLPVDLVYTKGVTCSFGVLLKMKEEVEGDNFIVTKIEISPTGEKKLQPDVVAEEEVVLASYSIPTEIGGKKTSTNVLFYGMPHDDFQPKSDIEYCNNTIIFNNDGLRINVKTLIWIVKDLFKDGFSVTRIEVNPKK